MVARLLRWATRSIPRHWLHLIAIFSGNILAQFFRGKRFQDPIDGFTYRKLLPYGRTAARQNALAPASLSLERHRLLWLYLCNAVRIESAELHVLHMAPEWCLSKRLKRLPNLRYTTADLNSPWASIHCDIQALPFDNETFDLIICNHVLEHIPDDRLAMRELLRTLNPSGSAIFMVPQDMAREETLEDPAINTDELREKYYYQRDHLRLYGRDFPLRLESQGFTVEVLPYAQFFTPGQRTYFAIREEDTFYIAHKKG